MPKVKLLLSVGSLDAVRYNVPEACEGETIVVDDRQRDVLVDRMRIAVDVKDDPPPPPPVAPVAPAAPVKTTDKPEPKPAAAQVKPAEVQSTKRKEE